MISKQSKSSQKTAKTVTMATNKERGKRLPHNVFQRTVEIESPTNGNKEERAKEALSNTDFQLSQDCRN